MAKKISPWSSLKDTKPPIGVIVLFYAQGRVMAGQSWYHPLTAEREYSAFQNPVDADQYKLPTYTKALPGDFTHWRYLPDFE